MSNDNAQIEVTGTVNVTPQMLAHAFWEMDSSQQADFFAELERVAGTKLCFQMAGVVREIQERSDKGDRDAQNGFQTMLSHAQHYSEGATDYRYWAARRQINRMAEDAKRKELI